MSNHVSSRAVQLHYQQVENAKARRREAQEARQESFVAQRDEIKLWLTVENWIVIFFTMLLVVSVQLISVYNARFIVGILLSRGL